MSEDLLTLPGPPLSSFFASLSAKRLAPADSLKQIKDPSAIPSLLAMSRIPFLCRLLIPV